MTQCRKILNLLIDAYYGKPFRWFRWQMQKGYVPVGEICNLKIAQYNARIYELRHKCGIAIKHRYFNFDKGLGTDAYALETHPDLIEDGKRKTCECGANAWYSCDSCGMDLCCKCAERHILYRHQCGEIV